ncbi:unannotated protein [freshwater metagenome]|uniref:Unannotated protein n=1 Tax=freshwater metagenome TaxID=449393 RepID=A0A6J7DA05_9ZZZZ
MTVSASPTAPASVSAAHRVSAHARWELRLLLRNGEQILVMFVIPLVLLIALTFARGGDVDGQAPIVMAVSLMATCVTSLAIGTGFERRSGALKFLATTPLSRLDLLLAKAVATALLSAISIAAIALVSVLLGWRPVVNIPGAILAIALGGLAFAAWAVFLAGALRAEAVLALANGIFIVLIVFGGVVIATSAMPGPIGAIIALLPSAALASAMTASLSTGAFPGTQLLLLLGWAAIAAFLARRTFTWD